LPRRAPRPTTTPTGSRTPPSWRATATGCCGVSARSSSWACSCCGRGDVTMPSATRWSAGTFLLAAAVLVLALEYGQGAPQPVPAGIPDPGVLTGWGLPAVKVVADLAGIS